MSLLLLFLLGRIATTFLLFLIGRIGRLGKQTLKLGLIVAEILHGHLPLYHGPKSTLHNFARVQRCPINLFASDPFLWLLAGALGASSSSFLFPASGFERDLVRHRLFRIHIHNGRVFAIALKGILDSAHGQSHFEHLEVLDVIGIILERCTRVLELFFLLPSSRLALQRLVGVQVHNARILPISLEGILDGTHR